MVSRISIKLGCSGSSTAAVYIQTILSETAIPFCTISWRNEFYLFFNARQCSTTLSKNVVSIQCLEWSAPCPFLKPIEHLRVCYKTNCQDKSSDVQLYQKYSKFALSKENGNIPKDYF